MTKTPIIDFETPGVVEDDGITHINTLGRPKTRLGVLLKPNHEIGQSLNHPLLGSFRTVENLCCFLNTGGNRDNMRNMSPHAALNMYKLSKKYSCDKFVDLVLDFTLLKMDANDQYRKLMIENDLPFDHYYVIRASGMTVRPPRASILVNIYNDVRKILRGEKSHEFVRFKDMNFTELEKK